MIKLFFSFLFISTNLAAQTGADSLLNFIKQNKSRASVCIRKNNYLVARLNEDKVMPLASTVKIMVAIEFAKQAAAKVFDENSFVELKELDKYYVANTDGGAHPTWLKHEAKEGHIKNDSIKLIDVARGMIMFSSNANTEFLMDLLGFDNVKNNIGLLGLKKHTIIYPMVSSLFIYQNPGNFDEDKILKEIRKMSDETYSKYTLKIHNQLNNNSNYKKEFRPQDLTIKAQKIWSNKLPSSTTKEYVQICSLLNNRSYFDSATYRIITKVLETLMENPANTKWLTHAGMKGGSTIFVLTKALYATLKDGNKIELAYFFNDLTGQENYKLQGWMNDFELRILSDDNFIKQMVF